MRHKQAGFIIEIQSNYNIPTSVNIIHHINKGINYMTLTYGEKIFDRTQIQIKSFSEPATEETFLNLL